ncbi:hypothetical protein N781_10555 [Pontibacillus halophilus JSM 076056 = DSM 19796]|uniref:G5 domain-containing protein n=1 Tax=Pontibacillus halophilus JSM 076056 = DSM 19796 TaxID=1385510 RepID=A0A0A5GNT0_9BACI|nr:G5 domain-containing protein [Pontibacillus halophilus]KGX93624.1 hypothetical protein N781_10555 [Pontibacillus halophilus JSM 076056 = DSM 19796]
MKNREDMRLFLLLLGLSIFIYGFSNLGTLLTTEVFGDEYTYKEGTAVGPVVLSGLTKSEANHLLTEESNRWIESHPIEFEKKEEEFVIDKPEINFDIEQTLEQLQEGVSNPFVVTVGPSFISQLSSELEGDLVQSLTLDQLKSDLMRRAQQLKPEAISYSVYQYMESGTEELYEEVARYELPISDDVQPSDVIAYLNGTRIKPNEPYSILNEVEGKEILNERALNLVASGIYGAVLQTNFVIQQRHLSATLPDYAELGREASIRSDQAHDLVINNPNQSTYEVWVKRDGEQLVVTLHGYPLPNDYDVQVTSKQDLKPRTVVQYSSTLAEGQSKLVNEGVDGVVVEVYRTIKDNGIILSEEFISEDYYPPTNRTILKYGDESTLSEFNSSGTGSSNGDASSNPDDDDASTPPSDKDGIIDDVGDVWEAPGQLKGN